MKVYKTQDPKYVIIDNALCNASTKKPIPINEPIFILRGQDKNAAQAIAKYLCSCSNPEHIAAVEARLEEFQNYKINCPELIKEPDTATAETNK